MKHRSQQSIRVSAEVAGVGFLTGKDVSLRFHPAAANHGIAFVRSDCPGSKPIPARIEYTVPRQRRTAIERDGVVVELTEHVLAALAGLQVDNCLVEIDACEPPGMDGSASDFAEALLQAGIVKQDEPRELLAIEKSRMVSSEDGKSDVAVAPTSEAVLTIGYRLDYGPDSPIPPQTFILEITPESFVEELAFARTFVLESEVEALKAQGYGSRTTGRDLLVFRADGQIIDNQMRTPDECARHKVLDCLGDFALMGCDIHGQFDAFRSGHELNRDLVRHIKQNHQDSSLSMERNVA